MTSSTHHSRPIIVWAGRFFANDGYGTAARQHVAALRELGAPVVAVDIESHSLVGSRPNGLIETSEPDAQVSIRTVDPERPIAVIVHDRPDIYRRVSATGRSILIGYSYWETTSIPSDWARWMQSMDRVWTSSQFNADAFTAAGVPAWMVDIVGHPVDQLAQGVAASREQLRARWPESTVFLSTVSSAAGRRDMNLLLEAFSMAFDQSDDVALVLKAPESALDSVEATLERVMASMPARSSGRWPNLYIVAAALTREQLMRLHGSVDCYVSCERGNGWDLPAFDSLTMGIPVVASSFGASTTFVDPTDSYVVQASSALVACDEALNVRHPLYSGQYWPYVDPAVLATELRRAHDAPADRQKRGLAAAQRINNDFERSVVASQVMELTATPRDFDLRSSSPAEVRISNGDLWPRFAGAATFASHRRLHEAALAGLLLDPAITKPRTPGELLRSYKRATTYAQAHEDALAGTAVRKALSGAMAVSTRHPVRKMSAIMRLNRRIANEAKRLGDRDQLRRLATVVEEYEGALNGKSSSLSPEHLETMRRSVEQTHGPFKSPDYDLDRLRTLRNRYHGRVFVLGDDPSLLNCDLSKLADKYTFAVDSIDLLRDHVTWPPTFYCLVDRPIGSDVSDEIGRLEGSVKFVSERYRGVVPGGPDTYWYWTRPVGTHIDDQFEVDLARGIPTCGTAIVPTIQQAFYLGFREIIFVGLDRHNASAAATQRMVRVMRKGVEGRGGRLVDATVDGALDLLERSLDVLSG